MIVCARLRAQMLVTSIRARTRAHAIIVQKNVPYEGCSAGTSNFGRSPLPNHPKQLQMTLDTWPVGLPQLQMTPGKTLEYCMELPH